MIQYEKTRPLIKRIATPADTTAKILRYDSDNLYPQRMEEVYRRSSTLKSVTERIADFVNGEGFVDEVVAGTILNRRGLKGQTANKVLKLVSLDFVKWRTVAMHVGYNMLGQICELTPIKFERIRFGLKDECGKITHYGYSANWERDGKSANDQAIVFYHRFDPNPEVVLEQMEKCGGIANYKGQIIYLTPDEDEYPLASFDVVSDDAQVQGQLGEFKLSSVEESFLITLGIVYPGEFTDKNEENAFRDLISNKKGAKNAGGRIGIQDKTGTRKASDIFQPLTPVNLDKMYELTETTVKNNIMQNEAFPELLLGKTASGLLAQNDLEEAYTYVNSITRNRRAELSEIFSFLFSFWEDGIITDAAIIEQRYILNSSQGTGGVDINDNLKNMTGMQAINFARILRKYSEGKYDRATAETLLRGGFGLSSEEITKLLDGIDAAVAEEGSLPQGAALALAKDYL